ncbi:MAG TPA: hypothetical protein VIW68_02315 [Candidatus Sulfotelmatobacter sp.]
MTKYLDEYDYKSRYSNRRVQSDDKKLKFNNIQSCVAVFLVPVGKQMMIGIHLTTFHTESNAELQTAMQELKTAAGTGPFDGYLVCQWGTFHSKTELKNELKKLARALYLCDVPIKGLNPATRVTNTAADVDVKVEFLGSVIQAYVRPHVVMLKDAARAAIPKPGYDAKTALPGQGAYQTDRDSKPWTAISFRPLA